MFISTSELPTTLVISCPQKSDFQKQLTKNKNTTVHRYIYVYIMDHEKLAYIDDDATEVRLFPLPEPHCQRCTPTEKIQELKSYMIFSSTVEKEMGKEKFIFHKFRTALPEVLSIHPGQCHLNTFGLFITD